MADMLETPQRLLRAVYSSVSEAIAQTPPTVLLLVFTTTAIASLLFIYTAVYYLAPAPRAVLPSEKTYVTTTPSSSISPAQPLPCWYDEWQAHRNEPAGTGDFDEKHTGTIDQPELFMSVVIPAYNEEERLEIMLEEAVTFLDAEYGRTPKGQRGKDAHKLKNKRARGTGGYEILIVNDGSKDKTVDVALAFSRRNKLHDMLRICSLKHNRGKGGAVTHGFRHVRGEYTLFVDADGASRFEDLAKLVVGCDEVADKFNRGIAVGSRAHLVGSEAVVQRSALRNALMHSFHLLLWLLTPPATSRIRDTQCGFKLFSRASLPYIIPYMHAEGWIFDVEMLMLAESAVVPRPRESHNAKAGIRIAEVPIEWKEVGGSKLNVMWDSLGMAWGLAILRLSWIVGVYRRR